MHETYVYHWKGQGFYGNTIYPLNTLKTILPSAYECEVGKYQGREWLLDVSIPALNCLWNDVIHCSLMHPRLIYKTLTDIGFKHLKKSILWFEIPLKDILLFPSTIYLNNRIWQDTKILLNSDFEPVISECVRELSAMPERNLEYYRECLARSERPLFWKRAPHLLVKGEIDTGKCQILDWQ